MLASWPKSWCPLVIFLASVCRFPLVVRLSSASKSHNKEIKLIFHPLSIYLDTLIFVGNVPNNTDITERTEDQLSLEGLSLDDIGHFILLDDICADEDDESSVSNLKDVQHSNNVPTSVRTQHHQQIVSTGHNSYVIESTSILQQGTSTPNSPEAIPVLTNSSQSSNLRITTPSNMMVSTIHAPVLEGLSDRCILSGEKDSSADAVEHSLDIPDCRILDHIQNWLHLCYTIFILLCLGAATRIYWWLLSAQDFLLQEKQSQTVSNLAFQSEMKSIKLELQDLLLAKDLCENIAVELKKQMNEEECVHIDEKVSFETIISGLRRQLKNEKAHCTDIQRSKKDLEVEVERLAMNNKAHLGALLAAKSTADQNIGNLGRELGALKIRSEGLISSRNATICLMTDMESNHKRKIEEIMLAKNDLEKSLAETKIQAAIDSKSSVDATDAATLVQLRLDDAQLLLVTYKSRYEDDIASRLISDGLVVELQYKVEVAGIHLKELMIEKSLLEVEVGEMEASKKTLQVNIEKLLISEVNLREQVAAVERLLVQANEKNATMTDRITYLEVMATSDQGNAEELLSVNDALTTLITEIEYHSEENKTHARESQANVEDLLKSKRALQERVSDMEQRSKIDKIHAGKLSQFKEDLESHISRIERKAENDQSHAEKLFSDKLALQKRLIEIGNQSKRDRERTATILAAKKALEKKYEASQIHEEKLSDDNLLFYKRVAELEKLNIAERAKLNDLKSANDLLIQNAALLQTHLKAAHNEVNEKSHLHDQINNHLEVMKTQLVEAGKEHASDLANAKAVSSDSIGELERQLEEHVSSKCALDSRMADADAQAKKLKAYAGQLLSAKVGLEDRVSSLEVQAKAEMDRACELCVAKDAAEAELGEMHIQAGVYERRIEDVMSAKVAVEMQLVEAGKKHASDLANAKAKASTGIHASERVRFADSLDSRSVPCAVNVHKNLLCSTMSELQDEFDRLAAAKSLGHSDTPNDSFNLENSVSYLDAEISRSITDDGYDDSVECCIFRDIDSLCNSPVNSVSHCRSSIYSPIKSIGLLDENDENVNKENWA